jgi:hypothetical protein
MTPLLPKGFIHLVPGTGRVSDLSVAYRRVGQKLHRMVVSLGKRTLTATGIDPAKPTWGMFGALPDYTKMALVLRQGEMQGAVLGAHKSGALYFNVRIERLLYLEAKHEAEDMPFEVVTNPGTPVSFTFTFELPSWVRTALGPDNSAVAAMDRARMAAAEARRRMT